jgi:hypothetical protein
VAEYILCRDGGSEGHSAPLLALTESDVKVVLQVLARSYDCSLVIYRVDAVTGYSRDWCPAAEPRRITLDDFKPKEDAA